MAAAANLTTNAQHLVAIGGRSIPNSFPSRGSCPLQQNKIRIQQYVKHSRRQPNNRFSFKQRRYLVMSSKNDTDIEELRPFSATDLIMQFYTSINEKNLNQLDAYISHDCCFEDCSFPNSFQGKKEVMNFLEQLTKSMGQHVKFSLEHVCEGNELTAAVNWHLEWKDSPIPLTRGSSFYELSTEGQGLLIKKARVVIESPIKPGGIVLVLFKIVTSLFDDFPKLAEWILKSHHVILRLTLSIYTKFLAPFINPVLVGYMRLWSFMARLLGLAFNVMLHILKIFSK